MSWNRMAMPQKAVPALTQNKAAAVPGPETVVKKHIEYRSHCICQQIFFGVQSSAATHSADVGGGWHIGTRDWASPWHEVGVIDGPGPQQVRSRFDAHGARWSRWSWRRCWRPGWRVASGGANASLGHSGGQAILKTWPGA